MEDVTDRSEEATDRPKSASTATFDVTGLARQWTSVERPNYAVAVVAIPSAPDTYFATCTPAILAVSMRPKLEIQVPEPQVLLSAINGVVAILAIWMTAETIIAFCKPSTGEAVSNGSAA